MSRTAVIRLLELQVSPLQWGFFVCGSSTQHAGLSVPIPSTYKNKRINGVGSGSSDNDGFGSERVHTGLPATSNPDTDGVVCSTRCPFFILHVFNY